VIVREITADSAHADFPDSLVKCVHAINPEAHSAGPALEYDQLELWETVKGVETPLVLKIT
jgi:hypothetical protein